MKKFIIFGIFIANIHSLPAQKLVPADFSFRSMVVDSTDSLVNSNNMLSNVVTEVILQGEQLVWLGTGLGVSIIRDSLTVETLPNYANEAIPSDTGITLTEGETSTVLPEGGISAMAVGAQGNIMLIAVAGREHAIPTGKGVAYTMNHYLCVHVHTLSQTQCISVNGIHTGVSVQYVDH